MRARRLQIADNGTISRMTRNIFVMILWLFCCTTSWECFQPSPNPWSSLLPTISRLRGCGSGRWVVSTVLQSPGLDTYEPPAIRPKRCLNLGSWRADLYPRFSPLSRGPKRCLTRLTKGRLSRFTPRSTISWVPSHRVKICSVVSKGGCRIGDDRPTTSNCGRWSFSRGTLKSASSYIFIIGSSLPSEGSLCACHHRGDSPGGRGCRPSRRRSYDSPSGSFGHSSRQGSDTPPLKRRMLSDDLSTDGRFTAAAAGPSVSWRQPFAFAPDQPSSNLSGRSFHQGGGANLSPPPPPSSDA